MLQFESSTSNAGFQDTTPIVNLFRAQIALITSQDLWAFVAVCAKWAK